MNFSKGKVLSRNIKNGIKMIGFIFFLGKRSGQHKFYLPKKKKYSAKGCVFIKRDLFPPGLIASIENGMRLTVSNKLQKDIDRSKIRKERKAI